MNTIRACKKNAEKYQNDTGFLIIFYLQCMLPYFNTELSE